MGSFFKVVHNFEKNPSKKQRNKGDSQENDNASVFCDEITSISSSDNYMLAMLLIAERPLCAETKRELFKILIKSRDN